MIGHTREDCGMNTNVVDSGLVVTARTIMVKNPMRLETPDNKTSIQYDLKPSPDQLRRKPFNSPESVTTGMRRQMARDNVWFARLRNACSSS